MLIEGNYKDIASYKDPVSLFGEGCVAVVENKEKANPITLGWGGVGVLWGKPMCTVFIHESRYSKHMFDEADSFSACFFAKEHNPIAIKYFGTASGRDEDKIAKSGMTLSRQDGIPYLEEAEFVILCKKLTQTKFDLDKVPEGKYHDWYSRDGVHSIYFGEIVKVLKKP
ncbi:MAG: flavin reductase family protein [Bacilli bacterium]|nr:flavin reductase family protein [Bacilli bacterium]